MYAVRQGTPCTPQPLIGRVQTGIRLIGPFFEENALLAWVQ